MNGFRLLAIRPLTGTNKKFKKNLQDQIIYKFYQDFLFVDEHNVEISEINGNTATNTVSVIQPDTITPDIYSSDGIHFNVAAIVGPNGSGKSSLIDFYNLILYYLSCYHLGTMTSTSQQLFKDLRYLVHFVKEYYNEILPFLQDKQKAGTRFSILFRSLNENNLIPVAEKLISQLQIWNSDSLLDCKISDSTAKCYSVLWRYYVEAGKNYDIKINPESHNIDFLYKELNESFINQLQSLLTRYKTEVKFEIKIKEELNFQLFYQIDHEIYRIEKINHHVQIPKGNRFYTILLNYAHYSMNSDHLGDWIFKLLHKNDGYQTPIVINPYRRKGNIDINAEQELATDRLVYTIIEQYKTDSKASILGKYTFKKFILKRKSDIIYPFHETVTYKNKEAFLNFLANAPFPNRFQLKKDEHILSFCMGYLIKKMRSISNTYMKHFYEADDFSGKHYPFEITDTDEWQLNKTKEFLLVSNSHISRKFNQTYNFLLHYDVLVTHLNFLKSWNTQKEIHLSEQELREWIDFVEKRFNLQSKGTEELIRYLFPALFTIDIEFEKEKQRVKLSDLSSGEQQYIFNINTIIYHINNLKTIHPVNKSRIKKYNYVTIILDEVELYYHPEYQKKLIQDLLSEIKKNAATGSLKNFNILLATHSPFILSDIPNQNILRIEEGKPSSKQFEQTFGANIHDLLANDFFLNGFMGEFAKNCILKLIEKINKLKDNQLDNGKYEHLLAQINLIGEPVIKNSVLSLLESKFADFLVLKKRQIELKRELAVINAKLKN
ncbi:AAA family ATPase [Flavobacterium cerinum]|uniref:AAA family ATPase n=1 Tax=Flavobacterium cerinum TaxID=2502784 RepID=A0ABY5IPZ0_9FLAO|nr:AAA family ATPase [Flavobacterium cerinum]UUC44714.1 AAA family ATPase [Flavobacterium cerinum]